MTTTTVLRHCSPISSAKALKPRPRSSSLPASAPVAAPCPTCVSQPPTSTKPRSKRSRIKCAMRRGLGRKTARADGGAAGGRHFVGLHLGHVLRDCLAQFKARIGPGSTTSVSAYMASSLRERCGSTPPALFAAQGKVLDLDAATKDQGQLIGEGDRRTVAEHTGQAVEKARAQIARTAQGLPELDAVLGLEMTARGVVGAGESDEGRLLVCHMGAMVLRNAGCSPQSASRRVPASPAALFGRAIAMLGLACK